MYTIEKAVDKILIRELPPMKVAAYRIISASLERDAIEYMKDLTRRKKLNLNHLRKFGINIPVFEIQQNMGLHGYEL